MPNESYEEAYDEEDEALEDYDDESFEYDNDDESVEDDDDDDDEAFEDDDDDDDDESFEDDDDDDEAFEDDDDDESFEDDDDDDESFAGEEAEDDEAAEISLGRLAARVRARSRSRARARSKARARSRARARAAARRARANRMRLSRRFKRIRGARRTRARALRRVRGTSIITATLPNGRKTRMRISPSPASAKSINKLRAQIAANTKRQAKAASANAKAIRKLSSAQASAVKKLSAQQVKADKALSKRIVSGDNKLDKRLSKEIATIKGGNAKHRRMMMIAAKRNRRRALWNSILVTTALPFFAAYGNVDNPISRNNLILTGSLAGWMLGDEALDRVKARGRRRKAMSRGSDLWSYLAPVGNAATVWGLLKDKQHVRFLSGTTSVPYGTSASNSTSVQVMDQVAEGYRTNFIALGDSVRVVATIATDNLPAGVTGVTASVSDGVLTLTLLTADEALFPTPGNLDVAWIVDTQDPND